MLIDVFKRKFGLYQPIHVAPKPRTYHHHHHQTQIYLFASVSLKIRLHAILILALDRHDWSALCSDHFTLEETSVE